MPRAPVILPTGTYSLHHLEPFTLRIPGPDPQHTPARLLVTMSHHVFSEKWVPGQSPQTHYLLENNDPREFCPVRYGWSTHLEALIRYHVNGKAYETRDDAGRMRHAFVANLPGSTIPYPIFFTLQAASSSKTLDGLLTVLSAYEKPRFPAKARLQSINFGRLVRQRIGFKNK